MRSPFRMHPRLVACLAAAALVAASAASGQPTGGAAKNPEAKGGKLATETPGTSTGYCMARKRPARARSSTDISRTSSPSRVTVPPVTVYFG